MRITFLLTQSLERPSGLGRYWPMARVLAAQGHQVTIFALHPGWSGLAPRQYTRDQVCVHYVGAMHIQQTAGGKRYYSSLQFLIVVLLATWRLTWHALRAPSDLIVLAKAQPMNGVAGILAHLLRRIPLWLDCDDYETGSNRFANRWQRRVVAWFESRLPQWADGVSVNTEFMRKYVLARGVAPERVCLLPNGVERERFRHMNDTAVERLREQWHLRDRRCVAYVGSLSLVNHAVDILLAAFAEVARDLADVLLLIVGDGEDAAEVQGLARQLGVSERTRFLGRIPPAEVPAYYRLAAVSVDPVRDDEASQARSPLKLFESWAAGVPFVTGDVGDRHTLLADGLNGILVTPDDPIALAKGIKRVLQTQSLAESLRQNGLTTVEGFWWDVLIQDWIRQFIDR